MEQVPCVHCGKFFIPRNRKQNYGTGKGGNWEMGLDHGGRLVIKGVC